MTRARFTRRSAMGLCARLALASTSSIACIGTTGGETFDFTAYAAGPEDAATSGPLTFETAQGWSVRLDEATLSIGAVYLSEVVTPANIQESGCLVDGRYAAQVPGAVVVDLLRPTPSPFAALGTASATRARAGEVWLMTGGDVTDDSTSSPVLRLSGRATKAALDRPFTARVSIGKNRKLPPSSPSLPGSNPLCRERIVRPLPLDITPARGGSLLVRVDPRALVTNVDFSALRRFSTDPVAYGFADGPEDAPSVALYQALRTSLPYRITWNAP
jgi:hypothetical protein